MQHLFVSEQGIRYPGILAKQGILGQNKEFENNDKDFIHLPRQHLPLHHGRERHDAPGQPKALTAAFPDSVRRDEYGGNRKPAPSRYGGEAAGSGDSGGSAQGGQDDGTGLCKV